MSFIDIIGCSIRAPESENLSEFCENLKYGRDMTTETRRYPKGYLDLPPRTGTLKNVESFDNSFFKYNHKNAEVLDPSIRMMLEVVHEAIMDSGIDYHSLNGDNRTGVYLGHCFSDMGTFTHRFDFDKKGPEIVHSANCMPANKISFFYGITGPSFVIDTACSSSLVALDAACKDIEAGVVDRAIVGGISLTLDPNVNKCFESFHMLSPSGRCFSFDTRANGYCRSEGIVAIVIQRHDPKFQSLGQILGTGVNNNGATKEGITYPSGHYQAELAKSVMKKKGIDPKSVNYIECHGTGTVAGDMEELKGLSMVYEHAKGMPIGSIKSNMGHAEGASGMISLVKCLVALHEKKLLPNYDFQTSPHEKINNGTFHVVTELQDYDFDTIQVNNFGFGGTNAVAFIKKANPESFDNHNSSVVGFSNSNVFEKTQWSHSQVALGNHIGFKYFMNSKHEIVKTINQTPVDKVAFLFPGQGSQWLNMGKELLEKNEVFNDTIVRLDKIVPGIYNMYQDGSKWMNKENTVIGIISYQIAVVNMFKHAGIQADFVMGHSLGEISAAYASGCLTEDQAILLAKVRSQMANWMDKSKKVIELNGVKRVENMDYVLMENEVEWSLDGLMCVVGMESDKLQVIIDNLQLNQTCIACYNSPNGQTVSGPRHEIEKMMSYISENVPGMFVRKIETDGIAYHSKLMSCYKDIILSEIKSKLGDIKECELSETNWIGTCGKTFHSHEYHLDNILNPVYFQGAIETLPPNTLIIEMGPSSPMITQIKRIRSDLVLFGLIEAKKDEVNAQRLSDLRFSMALYGYSQNNMVCPSKFQNYSTIWDHSEKFAVPTWEQYQVSNKPGQEITFDLKKEWSTLKHHVVDDHNLFPAMGYIYIIWKQVCNGVPCEISDFKIMEPLIINSDILKFSVVVENEKVSVYFEEQLKVTANVSTENVVLRKTEFEVSDDMKMSRSQFYSWIRKNGYAYGDSYRLLDNISTQHSASIQTECDWIGYLDACLHVLLNNPSTDFLAFPVGIDKVVLNCNMDTPKADMIHFDKLMNTIHVGDILTIQSVNMQPSKYNYRTTAEIRQQHFLNFEGIYPMTHVLEALKCMSVKSYTYQNFQQNIDSMFSNSGISYDASSKQMVITESFQDLEHFDLVLFKDMVDCDTRDFERLFTFVDQDVQYSLYFRIQENLVMINNWKNIRPNTKQCIFGDGAVSFRKTYLKEYPDQFHFLYASELPDMTGPITQTKNYDHGIYIEMKMDDHSNANTSTGYHLEFSKPGVLDSATWVETEHKSHKIDFAALNFRDIMRAFAKLKEPDMSVGLEFAGQNENGERVMGVAKNCIATHCEPSYTFPIPSNISSCEASTIPVVYLTVYYALFEKARVSAGNTVLVHAATGGVGQAALHVCKSRGINVIATCHHSKREWLKEQFGLDDSQIGDSRSVDFVSTVMKKTNGKGVNAVINSLSGDLQKASLKCLSPGGSFCEIGKYDIQQNTAIGQAILEKNISFHVIDLLPLLNDKAFKPMWDMYLSNGFARNEIVPLPCEEYHQVDTIAAFRDMSQAKHKGKISIDMRNSCNFQSIKRTMNVRGQTHLITGGLGGVALCLGVRLAQRGLKHVVLIGRSGVKNKWQQERIEQMERYGCEVEIICSDITTFEYTNHVDIVWHAATVYDDMMFDKMSDEKWNEVQRVKVGGFEHLRSLFPETKIIQCSSIVSYLGNPGQTNYAWANGSLDYQSYQSMNSLTLQFGAVDNVGFIGKTDNNLKILQSAASLELVRIDEMIDFIEQTFHMNNTVVSFYALQSKKSFHKDLTKWTMEDTAELTCKVFGGSIEKQIESKTVAFNDLGLDSLSRVELVNMINDIKGNTNMSAALIGTMTVETLNQYIKK